MWTAKCQDRGSRATQFFAESATSLIEEHFVGVLPVVCTLGIENSLKLVVVNPTAKPYTLQVGTTIATLLPVSDQNQEEVAPCRTGTCLARVEKLCKVLEELQIGDL